MNCRAAEKSSLDTAAFKSAVKAKLGEPYEVSYNKSQTYALCQQARSGDHIQRRFNYIIVRLADNKVIKEGSFRMGYVKWLDEDSIEVSSSNASAAKDNEKATKKEIIDIHSGQR